MAGSAKWDKSSVLPAFLGVIVLALAVSIPYARRLGLRANHVPEWAYRAYLQAEGTIARVRGEFDADEVVPGIWLGSSFAAMNVAALEHRGITAVVSVVDKDYHAFSSETSSGIQSMRIDASDDGLFDISPHFEQGINFIAQHAGEGNGVLIHCRRGASRSATLLMAFLMNRYSMTVDDALATLRKARPRVNPISHFMKELHTYELELARERSVVVSRVVWGLGQQPHAGTDKRFAFPSVG